MTEASEKLSEELDQLKAALDRADLEPDEIKVEAPNTGVVYLGDFEVEIFADLEPAHHILVSEWVPYEGSDLDTDRVNYARFSGDDPDEVAEYLEERVNSDREAA